MIRLVFLFVFFLIIGSCTKDKTTPAVCLEEVSFSEDVQPIIMNSCATTGCHSAAAVANEMNFESYENIFEHRATILKTIRHESGVASMPIGAEQLSADNIQKISCWINQGALNN